MHHAKLGGFDKKDALLKYPKGKKRVDNEKMEEKKRKKSKCGREKKKMKTRYDKCFLYIKGKTVNYVESYLHLIFFDSPFLSPGVLASGDGFLTFLLLVFS